MRFWSLCAVLGLTACSSSSFVQPPGDGDGGITPTPIEGGMPKPPPNCDVKKLPTEDPCVIDEGVGVFVSSSLGSPQGDGSRAKPYATIQAGITAAKASGRRVYACAESYAEAVTLAESVSVFGFFDCAASWKVVSKHASVLAPSSPAAIAKSIAQPTRIQALDVIAPDVAAPSASSVGLVAIGSPGLEIVDVKLHGGKGGAGADGADAVQLTDSGAAKNGSNASGNYQCNPNFQLSCSIGPVVLATTNACTGKGNIVGGPGGANGAPGYQISEYDANLFGWLWHIKAQAGAGGAQPATSTTAQGGIDNVSQAVAGANGANGANGAPGADVGMFTATGEYAAARGISGGDGVPGQGGGAGAGHMTLPNTQAASYQGYYFWGARGGGGGAGGCPGLAGDVGGGGGASVGLLAIGSGLKLTSSTVESSTGGAGGKAGKPSSPSIGGDGGLANQGAQAGAKGGWGGFPGISGNGAGGPSIAIAYSGAMPTASATSLTPGAGGAGVPLRVFVDYNIPGSPDGKSAATYAF